jgi:Flp pilus assembly pilin Flp
MRNWKVFYGDECGQDMVEYTLLMSFVCLASAAIFIGVGKTVASIWGSANKTLSQAYSAANNSS